MNGIRREASFRAVFAPPIQNILPAVMVDTGIENPEYAIPEGLVKLLSATKKSEVLKLGKKLVLSDRDLTSLVFECGSLGYSHIPVFQQTDVSHIADAFFRNEITPESSRRTAKQFREECKMIAFHFFVREEPPFWHLFFGDTTEKLGQSRFVGGSHVHFTNMLWGVPLLHIVDALPNRPNGSVHIKIK